MAERTARLRIELDGEKQYKKAVEEINRENRTLGAQMQKLAAEYKGNEKSVEALTKKHELLDRQLLENQAKVQETKKQLNAWREAQARVREELGASSEEYKTTQKKIQEYEAALARAETAEIKTQNAIKETNEALENTGKITITVGDAVNNLASKLGINLPQSATQGLNGVMKFSTGTVAAMGASAAAIAAVVKVAKELDEITMKAASKADDLQTQSVKSGLSLRQLQAINYASPFIDVDTSTFTTALEKMPRLLSTAQDQWNKYTEAQAKAAAEGKEFTGTLGAQAQALVDLGVSWEYEDGTLRNANDAFWDIINALHEAGDTTETNAIANDICGKSYADLKPLIQNAEEAQRLMNEANAEGYVLSEEQIKILGELQDQHDKNRMEVEKLQNTIALQFAPASKKALEVYGTAVQKAGQALDDSKLVANFASLVESTLGLVDAGAAMVEALPTWVNPLKMLSDELRGLALVMAAIADFVTIKNGLLPWNWGTGMLKQGLGYGETENNVQRIGRHNINNTDWQTLNAYNAAGTENWRGGLTWVGEAGPELVALPRGSRIYSNQESQSMGVVNNYHINVNGVQELEEVLSWYESRRVRQRMR